MRRPIHHTAAEIAGQLQFPSLWLFEILQTYMWPGVKGRGMQCNDKLGLDKGAQCRRSLTLMRSKEATAGGATGAANVETYAGSPGGARRSLVWTGARSADGP
mmetsp:Transcript_4389/g.8726  ORF Transcript_4389/g.8726 Transcript_4389/m.8726 type:complete len:103 (-) Transcript_4389:851-1159(-)